MQITNEVPNSPPERSKPLPSVRELLIWLVMACFVPAMLGCAALLFHEYQRGLEQLQKDTLHTARALVQTIDAKLVQVELLAQILATADSLNRQDFAAFHRRAQSLLEDSSIAQSILIYDVHGQQLVNTRLPLGQPLPKQSNPAQIERVFTTGKTVTSEVFQSPLNGLPVVSVASPVFSGTKVVFALAIDMAPQQFNNMLSQQKLPPQWVAAVLDSTGTLAARTHSAEKYVGQKATPALLKYLQDAPEGIHNTSTLEGIPTVSAYSRSPHTGWSVAIGIPRQSLEAELTNTLMQLGAGAILLLGLSLGLAWVVAGRMNTAMRALRTSAIALGAGEQVVVPQVHLRELDEVAQAMACAARLLMERTRALELTHEALMTREAELADAQRIAKIGSWTWDTQNDAILASPELCRIFGLVNIPSFYQQDGVMFQHQVWLELHQARLEVLQTGLGYNLELPALHADGSQFWVNSRSEAVHDAKGKIIGLRGMMQDITERKQAESVAKSERFIRTITDAMPGLVAYWDKELRCCFANQAYLEWFGKAPEEIIGGTMMELLGEALFALNEPYIRAALAGEKQQFERTLTKADGRIGYTLANYVPDINGYGIVAGFYVLITDVTQLKLAEAELQLAAAVYQNTAEGIMVADTQGFILSVNPAFTLITGYLAQEAIGQTPRMLRSNHHEQEFHAAMWQQVINTGQWQGEIWNRRKNGELFLEWQSITSLPGLNGESLRYLSVFRDITEHSRLQAAQIAHAVDSEVSASRQRLRELVRFNDAALEEDRKHIAREVHDELGQVLTALRMDIALVGMQFGLLDPAVNVKVKDMKRLIDRAILGVRNVAVNLRPAALDMGLVSAIEWLCNEFTRQTTIACVLIAEQEDIDLDNARAVMLFRIVQESLTNITRYAEASQVDITLGRRGNELGLEVRDNGRGFDLVAAATRKSFGLLGMRERALALGGRVDIVSAPGLGTVVAVTIPIDPEISKESS